jgi:hypothetical protein
MSKALLAAACLLAATGAAQAQEFNGFKLRPFVGGGLTVGGDKIDTVYYANDSSATLHAGNLVQVMAGIDARFTQMYSMQFNVGYQVDFADGDNGSLRFERFPVEVLGYIHVHPQARIGVGARWVTGTKVAGEGVLGSVQRGFKTSRGAIIEGEYFFNDSFSLRARYVAEKYEPDSGADKIDGNHFGLLMGWYF